MANYTLKNDSLTASLKGVLAVDEDGAIKMWATLGAVATHTSGSGLTITSVATSATTWNSASVTAMVTDASSDKVAVASSQPSVNCNSGQDITYYAAIVDYDGSSDSTFGCLADVTDGTDTVYYCHGVTAAAPGSATSVFSLYDANRTVGTQTLAGNTNFGIAGVLNLGSGTNRESHFYGAAGGNMTEGNASESSSDWSSASSFSLRTFLNHSTKTRNFLGKVLLVAVWNRALSGSELNTLNADPMGALFTGGASASTYLKLLAHSSAASATNISGVVFEAPTGGNITGTKIGEFTGAAFEASLESGQAVLKVATTEFDTGSPAAALTTSDTPVALVRNASNTTGIVSCTVIEE